MKAEILIRGIAASAGTGTGPVHLLRRRGNNVPAGTSAAPEEQLKRFLDASASVKQRILDMKNGLEGSRDDWTMKLFDTHIYLAGDPELKAAVEDGIRSRGLPAEAAVTEAAGALSLLLENSGSEEMAERAADLRDVAARINLELGGVGGVREAFPEGEFILAAEELSPLDTSALDPCRVRGIITAVGGYSCHTAIIARSLGIPAVTGTGNGFERLNDSCTQFPELTAIVEGGSGEVVLNPYAETLAAAGLRVERNRADKEALGEYLNKPTVSLDGVKIELCAHLGGLNELESVADSGAEGIGLFRSEFLFLGAGGFPDEQQQFEAYRAVLERMGGRRVVIRTLDIGGDKNVPFAGIEAEQNPFLGVRGIRYSLARPDILRTQLRALLRASVYGRLAVMIPMAATEEEVAAAREIFDEEKDGLRLESVPMAGDVEFGIMIEVPSAALTAGTLAGYADFFSIGTNDLVQYTMAADRMNPAVAGLYQPMHPAVTRLIAMVAEAASAAGIGCSVCGEAASDPEIIPELLRLGIRELSVSAPKVLPLRQLISGLRVEV